MMVVLPARPRGRFSSTTMMTFAKGMYGLNKVISKSRRTGAQAFSTAATRDARETRREL